MTQQDYSNNTAPKSGRAAIYARVARTQAAQPQTAALIALANEQGFSNERIIVYEDENPSAKRPIARRGALSDLLAAIMQEDQTPEHEPIRAIYVSSAEAEADRHGANIPCTFMQCFMVFSPVVMER